MEDNFKQSEYLALKSLVLELKEMISLMIPQKASVSYLSETTGKSRQSIRQFLINNFEPEVDYWVDGGKMFASQKAVITILNRSSK
ncbi:hypothetical protein AMRN_0744 [Malaciobacter marinus]|uniref:Uncharacterized protein n=2 Tax=Arcobacteraceae TaxID=2808963 RepID=A0A347TIS0_9BACT|nr:MULTISPECIES: hypothetical protein [Arcobacteraceae]AXX86498.1 hypothetical protein AMRN_0744 [Malaciobacter marinus]PHO14064.1 hypothetical protein CPH92_13870 [Malaciobacter marinus]RXK11688.1 hypothetical protein CP965_13030 [Halarcobacter mediterraneus]